MTRMLVLVLVCSKGETSTLKSALCPGTKKMVPYSILVIAKYNLSGSKIICNQMFLTLVRSIVLMRHSNGAGVIDVI